MNNNISKKVIINNLSNKTGFSNNFSKKLINDFILVLITHIKKKKLNLKNVGTFKFIEKKERLGRNPKTKEQFIICSRKSVSFTASKNLLLVLNQNK